MENILLGLSLVGEMSSEYLVAQSLELVPHHKQLIYAGSSGNNVGFNLDLGQGKVSYRFPPPGTHLPRFGSFRYF